MNPGLGVRALHAQGITGKGVSVAIIDECLCFALREDSVPNDPEYGGKIVKYHRVGTDRPIYPGSDQGPVVVSLLVGENIGTAPEARVYYAAVPSWTDDAQYYADALNWIVDQNQQLTGDARIRVVSVSTAPSGYPPPRPAWDEAYKRAMKAGILVLDYTREHGVTAPCYCDLDDPDDIARCTPGWPDVPPAAMPDRIHVPVFFRTQADDYCYGYQYAGLGDPSWSVPYLAGVLAMGWQVRPDLTGQQLLDLVFQTAYIGEGQAKIINPPTFIEAVKRAGES